MEVMSDLDPRDPSGETDSQGWRKSVMVKEVSSRNLDSGFKNVGCEEGRRTEGTEERKEQERRSMWSLGYKTEALIQTYME